VPDTRHTRMVLAVLVSVALALIAIDGLGGSGPLRTAGDDVLGAAERVAGSVISPVAGFFEHGTGAAGSSRIRALERQLITLRARLSRARLSRSEYAQLAQLLRLQRARRYHVVAANVIAVGQGYDQTVTLDAGSGDGIRQDETVLNGAGLVGTVTAVSRWTSTVLLATDATAVAGVRLAGSGQMGWVTGAGKGAFGAGSLRLRVLGAANALAPGQRLVTSASVGGRPYVAGVPVGVVTTIGRDRAGLNGTALVRPFVDFAALDVVGVVTRPASMAGRRSQSQPGSGG
jgi:rod shape-determining protein MreC